MIKVLYIGHYKEASGWGQVARDYILALDSVGIDVVPRSIKLDNPNFPLPTRLIELEQKESKNCNICIQHVLPHFMKYDGYFKKNIGLFELETNNIKYTSWPSHLNLMDEIWVPCAEMKDNAKINGIEKQCRVIPHTFNIEKYNKKYDKLDIPDCNNSFTFYFIGEYNRRKHVGALIRAFHSEFTPGEPVTLLLKINRSGMSENELSEDIKNLCNKIKQNLRLYQDQQDYKSEIIITRYISDDDMMKLHSTCDCFVMPSFGDAWNIPCWEAMAMGNPAIATKVGGMRDYITSYENGFLINAIEEPIIGVDESLPGFGTGREMWHNISIKELMEKMRLIYENRQLYNNMSKLGIEKSKMYSYEKIGNLMKELLHA